MSSPTLNTTTISIQGTIHSDSKELETHLVQYCTEAKLFIKIKKIDSKTTQITVQGYQQQVLSILDPIKELLLIKYHTIIDWGEISPVSQESRILSKWETAEFEDKELDEISFGDSATTKHIKKLAQEIANTFLDVVFQYFIANGWAPAVQQRLISVKRGDERYYVDISRLNSLQMLYEELDEKFDIPQPIKQVYTMEDGDVVVITNITELQKDRLYYALAGSEEPPKKNQVQFSYGMEEFFENLKTEQELDDDDIDIIKDCFRMQKIKFKHLMETGDLALTYDKLKEIGIAQGGLRTAILSLIKSHQ